MARTDLVERKSQRSVPIWLFVVAAALLAARIASSTYEPETPPAGTTGMVRWVSPEAAMDLVRTSQKPVLFNFTAEWCEPCHQMDREVFSDRAIADDINRRFIPVRVVNTMREEGKNSPIVAELERVYSVRGFPTIVIADPSGEKGGWRATEGGSGSRRCWSRRGDRRSPRRRDIERDPRDRIHREGHGCAAAGGARL
jgi:thiol:disulfide interchange protein